MFTLISVDKKAEAENLIQLNLNGNPFLPREFKDEYKNYQLKIYGLKNESVFLSEIGKYIGEFIDIEEVENEKLDFWSDTIQIGEFKFEKYEEIVTDYGIEDWKREYQSAIRYFYKQYDNHTKDTVLKRKFIDNLIFFLKKEIDNSERKNEFLGEKAEMNNPNKKAIELANKILNLIEQYKKEENRS